LNGGEIMDKRGVEKYLNERFKGSSESLDSIIREGLWLIYTDLARSVRNTLARKGYQLFYEESMVGRFSVGVVVVDGIQYRVWVDITLYEDKMVFSIDKVTLEKMRK